MRSSSSRESTNWPYRGQRTLVYGHRGVRDGVPENTLLAFEWALKRGADGIEFDVQMSADGVAVVFHDETLERMTGGRDCRRLSSLEIAELLTVKMDAGATIPTLREVLHWAGSNALFLNIELKCNDVEHATLLEVVDRDIRHHCLAEVQARILISSFSQSVLAEAAARDWRWPMAQLFDKGAKLEFPIAEATGVHPHHSLIAGASNLGPIGGRFVNVWTVNHADVAYALGRLGVDGIITDEIGIVRAALD